MQQLRTPNYTVKGEAGWCLSVQDDVWGVPHMYLTAHDAYNSAQFKHSGETPPAGIDALCYWTYSGDGDAWHVATRAKDGRMFSSPFDVAYGNQWFASIDAMTARIRKIDPSCQYVGWVEDLSGVRLVKEEDMVTDKQVDEWISLFHQEAYGKAPTDDVFNSWRPVLKNNFIEGSLSIMQGTDTNAGALKNKPTGNFVPVNEQLYKKG